MLYRLLKIYITLGLNVYFKKLSVNNLENVPKEGPVLFVANHQNALLDALLIVTSVKRKTYFLARADAFKSSIAKPFLAYLNMLPIFRLRDGISTVNQNQEIFDRCFDILNKGNCLTIFPEGNHDLRRRLRPLSKGFTRIALGALENKNDLNLKIVPVGINYTDHQRFRGSVSLYYGKAIDVSKFYSGSFNNDSLKLKERVSEELKKQIVHIENGTEYQKYMARLKHENADFLNPVETNKKIEDLKIEELELPNPKPEPSHFRLFENIIALNNALPLLFWNWILNKIKDPVMIGTFKFCYGVFLFPLFYFLQSMLITTYTNLWIGLSYFTISIFSVPLIAQRTIFKN